MNIIARLVEIGAPADVIEEVALLCAEKRLLDERRKKDRERKHSVRGHPRTSEESLDTRGSPSRARVDVKTTNSVDRTSKLHTGKKSKPRDHPLPDDWKLTPSLIEYAERKGLSRSDASELAEAMRNWAGSKGIERKSWDQTFQTFVQREAKERKANGHGKTANRSSLLDLYDELNEEIAGYERAENEGGGEPISRRNDGGLEDAAGGREGSSSIVPLRLSGSRH